jgi:spore germination protein GerM
MSFFNDNVKLLSVEQLEDTLTLNFNEYIYSNLDTKEILEEVIYTICLSVEDNYDVKQIVFNVNEEEIYKSVLKSIE